MDKGLNCKDNGQDSMRSLQQLGSEAISLEDNGALFARTIHASQFQQKISRNDQPTPSLSISLSSAVKFPRFSPGTPERVFPIRSLVAFESNPSSSQQTPSIVNSESQNSSPVDYFSSYPNSDLESSGFIYTPVDTGNTSLASTPYESARNSSPEYKGKGGSDEEPTELTERLGSTTLQSISSKGSSELLGDSQLSSQLNISLSHVNLDDVHKSPYFGSLFVLHEVQGRLEVQVASNNTKEVIGYSPEELFELNSFCDILSDGDRRKFYDQTKDVRDKDYEVEHHGPEVCDLSISASNGTVDDFWCSMHTTKTEPDIVFCEIEPRRLMDRLRCSYESDCESSKKAATVENSQGRTDNGSDNLTALRAFDEHEKDLDAANILNQLSRIIQLATSSQSIETLCKRMTRIVKELTGFHRVTVYQLNDNWEEPTVTETMNSVIKLRSYNGTSELAISRELRESFLTSKVCFLHNKQLPIELIYKQPEDSMTQLDMTHSCLLRKLPVSIKSSAEKPHAFMSINIRVFGKPWGMIGCQSYDEGFTLSPPLRKLCWLISDIFSSNIERLSYRLPSSIPDGAKSLVQPASLKVDKSAFGDILGLFGADYAVSSISGETKILGKPSDLQEILALVEVLKAKELDTIYWSTNVTKDFQGIGYPPAFKSISSLLYVPLDQRPDFIIFFKALGRNEFARVDYDDHMHRASRDLRLIGTGQGNIVYKQNDWPAVDIGKAKVLSLVYRTFADIWRQKENTQLMKLLLANCAHEVRTPLNAIINYLEIALDGNLNDETRESLARSHSASKSLVFIINDLLDLANAENGNNLIGDEVFDISNSIREAACIFNEEARQKNLELHVVQRSRLPYVLGDRRRVRQVITNLISNAVQNTSSGGVTVEYDISNDQAKTGKIGIEVAVHDTGSGMSQEVMETLFCQLEQVSNWDHLKDSQLSHKKAEDSKNVLGLGLALVARIVYNLDGQLFVKTELGEGSCFKIKLNFPLPADGQGFSPLDRSMSHIGEGGSVLTAHENNLCPSPREDPGVIQQSPENEDSLSQKKDDISSPTKPEKPSLNILVAEDDPVNSKIVQKRLEKLGYKVHLTTNGKECASTHRDDAAKFDAILMDLNMPIVDGSNATKMIREFEQTARLSSVSDKACGNRRIPIFAISASLLESELQTYVDSGFDGWLPKPVDFSRLDILLNGIHQDELRAASVYQPGRWTDGGWFERKVD